MKHTLVVRWHIFIFDYLIKYDASNFISISWPFSVLLELATQVFFSWGKTPILFFNKLGKLQWNKISIFVDRSEHINTIFQRQWLMTLKLLSQQLFFEADIPCLQLNLPHGTRTHHKRRSVWYVLRSYCEGVRNILSMACETGTN